MLPDKFNINIKPPIIPGINKEINEITVTGANKTNKNLIRSNDIPVISNVYAYVPLNPYFNFPSKALYNNPESMPLIFIIKYYL